MKLSSGLFAILLIIWMGGSTYWYVCKIKDQCNKVDTKINTESKDNKQIQSKSENAVVTEKKLSGEEIINDVKDKISKGYTIYYFPKNSIEKNNIEASFDEFADNLKLYLDENKEDKIKITGHTDDIGSDMANMKFGLKRAKFIKSILTKKGIESNRISVKSEGEKQPFASNETEDGKKQNRRVVIILIDN